MPRVTGGSLEAHRRDARARAFDAFARLMYERGYDAITLADIAETAGMARTSMYNYYPTKEALLVDYTAAEMARFVDELRVELYRTPDPVDRLRTFVRQQLEYLATHHLPPGPALRDVLSSDAFRSISEHAQALDDILHGILIDGAATKAFPQTIVDDPATVSLVLACITSGAARTDTESKGGGDAHGGPDARIEATVQFVLRAVGAG
ncbi:MAG: TetR/AcrR family transcriptional regulator [Acidimicrobiia bacterium]